MGVKVCKFGGTSLANADQIRKAQQIIESDPERRYVVPSAPGKRSKDDQKITDLLYLCREHARQGIVFNEVFSLIQQRFEGIASDLGSSVDLGPSLQKIKTDISEGASADYTASRGEYLNGLIIADLLGFTFIDPADVILFHDNGTFDGERTQAVLSQKLAETPKAVVPGFFGALPDGQIKTFSRGGSDITGAIVARAANAEVYENWSDVDGLLMADPRIVDNPRSIEVVTYRELRELAYMGATVLHDEAIFPVRKAGIPVNIRNTNAPENPGSRIVAEAGPSSSQLGITGIAGRKDFTVIAIEKALMNTQIGFGRKLLGVLESNDVSYEHTPSGIDTMSVVMADSQLDGKLDDVLDGIRVACKPDSLEVQSDMALIATVGRGMAHTPGMAGRLFGALANANVNVRMIDQGSSELNIIVGVEASDFETAIRAIYSAFVQ